MKGKLPWSCPHAVAPSAPREIHPAGPDRGDQSVLASDQVLAVPAARSRHAGRLSPAGRRGGDRRRTCRTSRHGGSPGSGRHSGLHHQRETRLRPGRRVSRAGRVRRAGRPARDVVAGRGRGTCGRDISRPGRADLSAVPRGLPRRPPAAALPLDRGPLARAAAADPPRSDPPALVSGAELDRRDPRLSAALRLLLQGRVLRGRALLLHPARRRRAGGDPAPARPPSLLPGRSSLRRPPLRRVAVRGHARDGTAVPGRGDRRLDPARRSRRTGRRSRAAQPVRRLRNARPRATWRSATNGRTSAATTPRSPGGCTISAS